MYGAGIQDVRLSDYTSKWNLLRNNANAPRKEILQRSAQYIRRWYRTELSGVLDAMSDAFN
jgi:hypothetical protein